MKKVILNLLLLFSTATIALSNEGWQKVKWGMTLEQVKKEYPQAILNDPPGIYKQKGVVYKSPLKLKQYVVANRSYFVDFLFAPDGAFAGATLGTPKDGGLQKGSLKAEYENLRDLLTEKYGPPIRIKPWGDGSESTFWNTGGTTIRLNHIRSEILGESGIRIVYLEKRLESLDKL